MKLLIIDDEHDVLDLATVLLTRHRIVTATGGEQGVALAARERPDAILLDCVMRGISGEETLARLRADERTRDIPVVLLTGKDDADEIRQLRSLGAHGLISKPIRVSTFAEEVERALSGEFITAPASESADLIDQSVIEMLRDLQGDDDPTFFTDLIATFVADADERLERIRASVGAGDVGTAGREAHTLKSGAGNVGAVGVAAAAAAIERTAKSGTHDSAVRELARLEAVYNDTRALLTKLIE